MPNSNKIARVILAAALMGLCTVPVTAARPEKDSQSPTRKSRTIRFTLHPIAEAILPDDEVLVVVQDAMDVALSVGNPTPDDLLRAAVAQDFATLALVDVTGVSGVLALEGTWVQTKFVASVAEVLKTGRDVKSRDRVSQGDQIEFNVSGGETSIHGVTIRAGQVVDYPAPGQYLVTLGVRSHENGFVVSSMLPLLVKGQTLSAVAPLTSKLTGRTLDDVRRAAKAR